MNQPDNRRDNRQMTAVERANAEKEAALGLFKRQLRAVVDDLTNVEPKMREALYNGAMIAVMKQDKLLTADRASFFMALRQCADDGVIPDGKEAALIPYQGQVQYQIMVWGIVKRIHNSGKVDTLWADVVYKGEPFTINTTEGDRKPDHVCNHMHRGPDGQARDEDIVGAYAVARLKNGFIDCEPVQLSDLMKIRAVAKTKDVWDAWFAEKCKVAALKRLGKRLAVASEDRAVFDRNEEFDLLLAQGGFERPLSPLQRRIEEARQKALMPPPDANTPPALDHEAPLTEDFSWTKDAPAQFDASEPEYEDGQAAYLAGADSSTCPYPKGTDRAVNWLGGWHDARRTT